MPLHTFRSYQLALKLYRDCRATHRLPVHLRDQLHRAASSIVLNLAEGSDKPTERDRKRFYAIALGSLREVQAVIEMESLRELHTGADQLGACLYRLVRSDARY
jgi:four helix bundle protein